MNTQIYEEATSWLIKHREAELDREEKRQFDAWLRESPQHVRAYLEMSALWEDLSALDQGPGSTPDQLITRARNEGNIYPLADPARIAPGETRLQSVARVTEGQTEKAEARTGKRLRRFPLALAATLVIAIVGVAGGYWFSPNTYATDVGEQRSIVLADGSTVELNSRSRVRVRYTSSRRDVYLLEGQALFQVAHNAARPFIVHSGTADIRAVGTQFDVYRKRAGTVVTVIEGKVAVRSGASDPDLSLPPGASQTSAGQVASKSGHSDTIFLTAGEQLTVPAVKPSRAGNSAAAQSPQRANVAAATAWTHRTLVFESDSLAEVAEEFNRHNTRQLVIADPELANIRISGVFSSVGSELLLKFLYAQPELEVNETEAEIRISKR